MNIKSIIYDIQALNDAYEEEKAIVDRVWKALNIENYEQAAKGLAIYEIVANLVKSNTDMRIALKYYAATLEKCKANGAIMLDCGSRARECLDKYPQE